MLVSNISIEAYRTNSKRRIFMMSFSFWNVYIKVLWIHVFILRDRTYSYQFFLCIIRLHFYYSFVGVNYYKMSVFIIFRFICIFHYLKEKKIFQERFMHLYKKTLCQFLIQLSKPTELIEDKDFYTELFFLSFRNGVW